MAQSSHPGQRAASGLGSHRLWEPPRKGYSWLFYKYIYIFFVARYCYLTLGLGDCSHPQTRLERGSPGAVPPWGARQCPGGSHPTLGVPPPH